MDISKNLGDTLFYFVPALLVLFAMFMVMKRFLDTQANVLRKFLERDIQIKTLDNRENRQKESMPLKLQAYERLILFLERISPNSLLVRVHRGGMAAGQ